MKKIIAAFLILLLSHSAYGAWGNRLMDSYDVRQATPTNGQVLVWNSTTKLWTLGTAGAAQTPWTGNINGGGFALSNATGNISMWTNDSNYLSTSTGLTLTAPNQTVTQTPNFSGGLNVGSATGVSATAAAGVLTLAGIGNTNNENITFNFESTANEIQISSSSGVGVFVWGKDFRLNDDTNFRFGTINSLYMDWETTGNDNFQIGTKCNSANNSGYINIMEWTDLGNANRSPLATSINPVLRIYSADATIATPYIEMYHDNTNANIGIGLGVLNIVPATDATTNTVSEVMRLTHSGGAIAAGFGSGLDFYLEDATAATIQQASRIDTLWTNATDATRTSAITFSGVTSGGSLTEWIRVRNGGVIDTSLAQTTYSGSVSGTATWNMPFQGSGYKKFRITLNALNDVGGTITYPVAFVKQPYIYGDAAALAICSTNTTTFTIAAAATITGNVFVEGY